MPENLKIVFFGTSAFGLNSLKLLSSKFNVLKVFTGLPKPAGRGKKLTKNPIHELAEMLNLKVNACQKPLAEDLPEYFDIGIVVSYGCIIPKTILEKAKYGFLNLHPSDLPLLRGASPIERTIEQGFLKTRVCIIKMTPKLDDGDIVISQNFDISKEEDSLSLHEKFSEIGALLFPQAVKNLISGGVFEKQDETRATYAKKITKEELFLPNETSLTCEQVINKIRAFASFGFTFLHFNQGIENGIRVKILKAVVLQTKMTALDIKTIDGFVSPILIKPEGKKAMSVQDFINGI